MQKQDFLDAVQKIGTCEDDVERRTLLAELSDNVGADYDSFLETSEKNTNLTADNEKLRAANMQLFLRVGEQKNPEQQRKDSTGIEDKKPEILKFEDLIDEKGGLK